MSTNGGFWRLLLLSGLLIALLLSTGCHRTVQQELTEAQANEILLALHDASIHAWKRGDRQQQYAVEVAAEDLGLALAIVRDQSLPTRRTDPLAAFGDAGGLLPSARRERAAYDAALAVALERSLETLPGIDSATVHLTASDPAPFSLTRRARHAAVLLRGQEDSATDQAVLYKLIIGTVPELTRENIELVWVPAAAETPSTSLMQPSNPRWVKTTLAVSLIFNTLMATLLLFTVARRRLRSRAPHLS